MIVMAVMVVMVVVVAVISYVVLMYANVIYYKESVILTYVKGNFNELNFDTVQLIEVCCNHVSVMKYL